MRVCQHECLQIIATHTRTDTGAQIIAGVVAAYDDGEASEADEKTRKGGFRVSCLGAYGDAAFTKGGKKPK